MPWGRAIGAVKAVRRPLQDAAVSSCCSRASSPAARLFSASILARKPGASGGSRGLLFNKSCSGFSKMFSSNVSSAFYSNSPAGAPLVGIRNLSSVAAANPPTAGAVAEQSRYDFDVAVVGGGPGGYVAAIRAAQLGMKTVCIEKRGSLGGTCLNVGCIPSKALLNATYKYHEAVHDFDRFGIRFEKSPTIDLPTLRSKKEEIVKGLTQGIEGLFKANKVTYTKGSARFTDPHTLEVSPIEPTATTTGGRETITLTTANVIIATGSEPSGFPGGSITANEKDIVTSTGALDLKDVPKHLVVLGGGVIGLELGSVYRRLGADVTVVELLDRAAATLDGDASRQLQKVLTSQGIKFELKTKVNKCERIQSGQLQLEVSRESSNDKGQTATDRITCDRVLLCIGRRPYTTNLGLDTIKAKLDPRGRIEVDEFFRVRRQSTESAALGVLENVFAIGDVIEGPMLAHKAEEEGFAVAEYLSGYRSVMDVPPHLSIPAVVYTHPEVAGVGATEESLRESGRGYVKGVFPFPANSRARANNSTDGLVKILACDKNNKLLGAWIVADAAGEMIHELALAYRYGASAEDIARTSHAHPTLSEAIKEACMATYTKAIHSR